MNIEKLDERTTYFRQAKTYDLLIIGKVECSVKTWRLDDSEGDIENGFEIIDEDRVRAEMDVIAEAMDEDADLLWDEVTDFINNLD